jgi:glycine/D-amino acid oxidase-like deaminating enzyme
MAPVFSGIPKKDLYLAGEYNGSGVSRGTAFGTALADYTCGGQSQLIDDCHVSPPAAATVVTR